MKGSGQFFSPRNMACGSLPGTSVAHEAAEIHKASNLILRAYYSLALCGVNSKVQIQPLTTALAARRDPVTWFQGGGSDSGLGSMPVRQSSWLLREARPPGSPVL